MISITYFNSALYIGHLGFFILSLLVLTTQLFQSLVVHSLLALITCNILLSVAACVGLCRYSHQVGLPFFFHFKCPNKYFVQNFGVTAQVLVLVKKREIDCVVFTLININ